MFSVYDMTREALKNHLKENCNGLSIDRIDSLFEFVYKADNTYKPM